MSYEEAIEWLKGIRSSWNIHASCDIDRSTAFANCAAEDAARTQQAYLIVKSRSEGLTQETGKGD